MRYCTIYGCDKEHRSNGLCNTHLQRLGRLGNALAPMQRIRHGYRYHPIYTTWKTMKSRCYNVNSPKYKDYGGRGITVCDRWMKDFRLFLEDVGERPEGTSLDRIDVDGNYEPTNVRWADNSTQMFNTRDRGKAKSGFRGVIEIAPNRWQAYISRNNKQTFIGYYTTIEEAISARLLLESMYYG